MFDFSPQAERKGQDFCVQGVTELIAFLDTDHLDLLPHKLVQQAHHVQEATSEPTEFGDKQDIITL